MGYLKLLFMKFQQNIAYNPNDTNIINKPLCKEYAT